MSSRRSGRTSGAAAASRDAPGSPDEIEVKPRQSTGSGRRGAAFAGGEIVHGKRNRGGKKSYVVDSSPDDEEEEEEEAEIEDEDDDEDDEDAEGDDDMELDAEGDDVDAEGEDADGDVDMDASSIIRPTIKVSRQAKPPPAPRSQIIAAADDDDDDDDLSDPDLSDVGDTTMGFGDETMADEDAEGEEIEVAGEEEDEEDDEEDAEGEGVGELDSDDGSQGEPDVNKMTKRQRARFEDAPQEYMKLSDEVQVKKHFTAEELSMRRQEMARRRRNLSDKRNEEVKMETINKLLKKQAPKVNRKAAAAAAAAEAGDDGAQRANPLFVRWTSNKAGVTVSVPDEMLAGPAGDVFKKGGLAGGKMVEEVA
jgi:Ino eighty subunit 2